MAVLEKIRVKFGIAISAIIALALLSFIIDPSTLQTVAQTMNPKNDVGKIAGKSVSYTDFTADLDRYKTINEIMTGSSVQDEQTSQQIRNAAWQELIDRYLFIENAKDAGINVGNAEMVALTSGDMISPIISQNPMFQDQSGNFSPENVVEFVKNVNNDPSGNLKIYWDYIQNTVYTQQFYAKYGSLFTSSYYLNALQEESEIASNNTKANVDFVLAPYSFEKDSTITVSQAQVRSYYKAHKDFYKQKASRDIEYVVFEVVPSQKDINDTNDKMAEVYDEFAATEADGMKAFLLKNSERQLSDYWYKAGELSTISPELNDYVFGGNDGASPIVRSANTFYAAKAIASANVPDSVYVKHILLQGTGAKKVADSLMTELKKGANFAALAAVNSIDQGSMADGEIGNIGWMTQTYMIPGFESVITAEVGKPFVLNTRYGTHVVLVSKKTAPVAKKKVAILEKTSVASAETFNEYYAKANKFATIAAGTYEGYKKAVDSLGVYSHQMNINEGTSSYGAIDNAKEVTRWAFDSKKNKASEIISVNQSYFFIAAVKAIHKEGYTPIEEVSPMIGQILYTEARNAKFKEEVAKKIEGITSLEEVAKVLNSTLSDNQEINFSTMGAQMDPTALGAMYVAPLNEISGPAAGAAGVYVFTVNSRETESFYTADDAKMMQTQKGQYSSQMVLPVMMEAADVKDNRARFF